MKFLFFVFFLIKKMIYSFHIFCTFAGNVVENVLNY